MDSRHLGEITLEGGVGGGWMDTTVDVDATPVPFRLEIDFPGRFDESVVNKIDLALDSLAALDGLARQTIAAAVSRIDSAPGRLFESWNQSGDVEEFLQALRPSKINLLPDGGRNSADRVVMEYRLPGSAANEKVNVRFREGIGPELD